MSQDENFTKEDKGYHRVPLSFLQNVNLVPHNFNLPEKPMHGVIVSRQLREDLFDTIFQKVQDIEAPRLIKDDDFFKVLKIEKTTCTYGTLRERIGDYLSKDHKDDQYVQCENWTLRGEYNGERQDLVYKIKVVQSVNDFFYTIVHPDTFLKTAKLYRIYDSL